MNGFSLASGTASLLGLALLTAMAVGDRPAVAGAKKPKTFSCSSSSACVTAANAGSGSGTFTSATSQNGLQGNTNSGQAAVYGENTASGGGNGVTGRATSNSLNDYAVFGDGGPNGGVPLLATSEYTGSDGADLIKTINDYDGSIPLYADTFGNVQILGYFYSAGACSSGCAPTRRRVISYGSRDTSPTTEDVGEAGLDGGKATIVMDSATLRGIDTEAGYEVFLTAEGDTNGLYVASKTAKAFVVRETRGGRASVPFAYRIVGRRSGLRPQRLHFVTITKNAHGAAEASQ